jgi:Zn-dependent M28 family amino/carboxypeptidase
VGELVTFAARNFHFAPIGLVLVTACLSAAKQPAPPATFDGARALEHIRQLVSIGPRASGSPGAEKARDYITGQLKAVGLTVEQQPFEARTPLGAVRMINLRATIPGTGQAGARLVIGGHYDTKLFREFTFVGANDGGSSAAFLIELARVLAQRKADDATGSPGPLRIELLFLDGEEALVEWQGDDHTYGSRHYVQAARASGDFENIRAFVLVDMIADRDLNILRESQSTPWLTNIIWTTARRLRRPEFVDEAMLIDDDHVEFLKAGVPAVDIIDMDYPAWHTAGDTLDKVSARSLQAVGDVLLAALPAIERHLSQSRR